jgi:hypothetical protein
MTEREPSYIAFIKQNPSLHRAWFAAQAEQGKVQGCTFGRFSVNDDDEQLALVEGWTERPDDQGEIRWHLTKSESKEHGTADRI